MAWRWCCIRSSSTQLQLQTSEKVRRLAIKSALSSKVLENNIVVLDNLTLEAPKTKEMVKF